MDSEPLDAPTKPITLFAPAVRTRSADSLVPWAVAALVVLLIAVGVVVFSRHGSRPSAHTLLPQDPYAGKLIFSGIAMSESTSLSGGKSTFIDGRVRNAGSRTVEGASLQVLFGSFDPTQPAQVEPVPLSLIRMHEPYIDTEPVSADPLLPGSEKEFRLIFEDISPNWAQQLPEIRTVGVSLK